jgi:hypothetical protein
LFLENLRGLALLLPDFWIERQLSIYFAFIGMKRACRRCWCSATGLLRRLSRSLIKMFREAPHNGEVSEWGYHQLEKAADTPSFLLSRAN